jgi:hypothetical protein
VPPRRLLTALAAVALALALAGPAEARQRPIVYVVVLDGLDGDHVEQGKAPFISSLLAGENAGATYFPDSSSVIPAETNPNHTAMMSGAYPGRSGIPANAFALYASLASEDSCIATGPFNEMALPTETSGESASCPLAQMVFEAIGRQGNPDELSTAGIFGKPKLGRIFAGRNLDPARRDLDYLWAPCASGADDDDYCGDVPTNPISGYALDDATVMDQVLASARDGVLGPGGLGRPDLTFVNLHQIDSAGHASGTGSVYDVAIAQADEQIERLVGELRARGEWKHTVLILVSDHSMDETPSKLVLTDTLTDAGIAESDFLAVDNGSVDLIYLADRESAARHDLLARMRAAILAEPGVAEVLYREPNPVDGGDAHTVDAAHPEWRSSGERSGDLFVTAQPGYAFSESSSTSNPLPGNHGAPQTADNFLAVTGGSELVRTRTVTGQGRRANPVNVDIAPTVMGLLGLFAPEDSRGTFLRPAFKRAALREVGRPHRPRIKVRASGLSFRPTGGRYDIAAHSDGRWQRVARGRRRAFFGLAALPDDADRVRVRSLSAASIKSGWRSVRLPR